MAIVHLIDTSRVYFSIDEPKDNSFCFLSYTWNDLSLINNKFARFTHLTCNINIYKRARVSMKTIICHLSFSWLYQLFLVDSLDTAGNQHFDDSEKLGK